MDDRVRRAVQGWVAGHRRPLILTAATNHPPCAEEGPRREWIAGHLRAFRPEVEVCQPTDALGISSHLDWPSSRDYRGRPNVFTWMPGAGPKASPSSFVATSIQRDFQAPLYR